MQVVSQRVAGICMRLTNDVAHEKGAKANGGAAAPK